MEIYRISKIGHSSLLLCVVVSVRFETILLYFIDTSKVSFKGKGLVCSFCLFVWGLDTLKYEDKTKHE